MKSKIIALLLLAVTFVSCSNDEEKTTYPEENPLEGYLSQSGFYETTQILLNDYYYEMGYQFIPNNKGTINAITCKLPFTMNNVRVTIWNATTKVALKTITIPNVQGNIELRHVIDPFTVDANTEYAITYMVNNCFIRKRQDRANITYPIRVENISVTGFLQSYGILIHNNNAIFPVVNDAYSVYCGDLSFVFQRTE